MQISQLIKKLEALKAAEGDLEVLSPDGFSVYGVKSETFEKDNKELCIKAGETIAFIQDSR